ncbi:MAG: hypothetical protein ABIK84_01170 [candidate division WOR-3 bacterium]
MLILFVSQGNGFEIQHNPSQFSFYSDRGFDRVRAPDFYPSGNPGAPELPVKYLHYIIPPDKKAEGIRITSRSMIQIPGSYYLFPAQRPVPLCSIPPWTPPDPIIYNSDSLYPSNPKKKSSEITKKK